MAQNYSVMHWSSLRQRGEEVLNVIDNVFPKQVCSLLHEIIFLFLVFFIYSISNPIPYFTEGPGSSSVVQNADLLNGRKRQSYGCWWFPGWTSLQGTASPRCAQISFIVSMLAHAFVFGQYVDQPGVAFCTSVTEDDDNITNTVDLYESPK